MNKMMKRIPTKKPLERVVGGCDGGIGIPQYFFLLGQYHRRMTNPLGTQLVEASNLLLGYNRPLTKDFTEAPPLPLQNPLPAKYWGIGEVTFHCRPPDAGLGFNNERLQSEYYPIPAPICDDRPVRDLLGAPTRWDGRGPVIIRK